MKILIVVPSFNSGGTITSLKNLVTKLDLTQYHIDLFAITNIGPNIDFFANYVNVLGQNLNVDSTKQSLKFCIKKSVFKSVKYIKYLLGKIGVDISPIAFKTIVRKLEKNNYDLVIGFQEGQATKFISYFHNIRKISWVRCDYSNMLRISNSKPQHSLYSKIDKIVCVSEYTKNVFTNLLPETSDKTISLHNLISEKLIIDKSKENNIDSIFNFDSFKIVSLGRIDPVKRFSSIPEIVVELKKRGLKFKWFIIGGKRCSQEYEILIKKISMFSLQEELCLLGEVNNPYPYIKNANLLVSTSLSEACPNVINEAKILGTPIVSTDFGSVYEFIEDNVNGLVSPIENIAEKIEQMISNETQYNSIKNNISKFKYDNDNILDVWYNEILVRE